MMLQRAMECKFLLMMIEITGVNEGDFRAFLSMLQRIRGSPCDTLRHCVQSGKGRKQGGLPWLRLCVTAK